LFSVWYTVRFRLFVAHLGDPATLPSNVWEKVESAAGLKDAISSDENSERLPTGAAGWVGLRSGDRLGLLLRDFFPAQK